MLLLRTGRAEKIVTFRSRESSAAVLSSRHSVRIGVAFNLYAKAAMIRPKLEVPNANFADRLEEMTIHFVPQQLR